jgi:hypothetical protein
VSDIKRLPGGQEPEEKTSTRKGVTSTLDLVRDGVRRFILNDASLGDFRKTIRSAGGRSASSTHPLTGTAFRKIVKQAIAERRRKRSTHPE